MTAALTYWGAKDDVPDTLICGFVEWDDGDDDKKHPSEPYLCGAEVYVTWTFSCPVAKGEPIFPDDVPKWAVSSSWQLECTNGHVHAMSGNQFTTADDAEQFDPTVVGP